MSKRIPYLTADTAGAKFFKSLKEYDIFEYSMNHYTYRDVEKLLLKHGVLVEYCRVGTDAYNKHGCFICEVVGFTEGEGAIKQELPKFDPEELMVP